MATSISVTVNGRHKEIPIQINLSDLNKSQIGVLLTHGAGGDLSSGRLPEFANQFANNGFPCLRFTCKGPLSHRVAVAKEILTQTQQLPTFPNNITQWIVSGHSMGARVAAQVASELPSLVVACVFFSYPLHPPGKPKELRDHPLTDLTLPLLFVRGSEDPFCTIKPWKEVWERLLILKTTRMIAEMVISGGGHSLKVGGAREVTPGALSEVVDSVKQFCMEVAEDIAANRGSSTTAKRKKLAVPDNNKKKKTRTTIEK